MKAFWNDCGRGVRSDSAQEVSLEEAGLIWSDEVRGVKGNFVGLIDDHGKTIQFYFDDSIPDDVDDAGDLRIVCMDFPLPERKGSFSTQVTIDEVHGLIAKAFRIGADYSKFDVDFSPW